MPPAQDPPDSIITETGAEVQRFMSENSCHSAVTSPSAGGFMAPPGGGGFPPPRILIKKLQKNPGGVVFFPPPPRPSFALSAHFPVWVRAAGIVGEGLISLAGKWSHFALLETIKGYQNKEIEPPGGEQCSRPVAL